MKCTRDNCENEAQYVVDGQSVCREHKGDSDDAGEGQTMGEKMVNGTSRYQDDKRRHPDNKGEAGTVGEGLEQDAERDR